MAIFASLIAKLGIDTRDWEKGAKKAKQEVLGLEKATSDTLKRLKGGFGEGSLIGSLGKFAKGAGALAGVTVLGNTVKDVSGGILELDTRMRAGEISNREYWDSIAFGIPLFGNFAKGMSSIGELIDRTRRDQAESRADAAAASKAYTAGLAKEAEAQRNFSASTEKSIRSLVDEAEAIKRGNKLANMTGNSKLFGEENDADLQAMERIGKERADALLGAGADDASIQKLKDNAASFAAAVKAYHTAGSSQMESRYGTALADEQEKLGAAVQRRKQLDAAAEGAFGEQEKAHKDALSRIKADIAREAAERDQKMEVDLYVEAQAMADEQAAKTVTALKRRKSEVEGSGSTGSENRIATVQAVRAAFTVVKTPEVTERMRRLGEEQLKQLQSINDALKSFGVNDDDADVLVNIPGI